MLSLLSFVAQPAGAWEVLESGSGALAHWGAMPVEYSWNDADAPDLVGVDDAVHSAFESWERVRRTVIEVEHTGQLADPEVALDDVDVVFFDQDWPWDDESLATATTWMDSGGRIVAFDIRINGRVPWATDGREEHFDLQSALTHEVGHVLGLDHTSVEDATMYAQLGFGEDWRRSLHRDDEDGAYFLYGEEDRGPFRGFGCATGPRSGGLLVLLLPLLICRRTR